MANPLTPEQLAQLRANNWVGLTPQAREDARHQEMASDRYDQEQAQIHQAKEQEFIRKQFAPNQVDVGRHMNQMAADRYNQEQEQATQARYDAMNRKDFQNWKSGEARNAAARREDQMVAQRAQQATQQAGLADAAQERERQMAATHPFEAPSGSMPTPEEPETPQPSYVASATPDIPTNANGDPDFSSAIRSWWGR